MEGDGEVVALVGNAVQAKLVGHVCHLIFLICLLGYDIHWTTGCPFFGKLIASLCQSALENFHEAVGIAVVVNRASLTRRPYKHELSQVHISGLTKV